MLVAADFGQDPWPVRHRRLVTHMLSMAASQIGHPIAVFVEMIPDDRLVHDKCSGVEGMAELLQRLKWLFGPLVGWKESPTTPVIDVKRSDEQQPRL